jgi:hypothetical protein
MVKRVGVTGTQEGATKAQLCTVYRLLLRQGDFELHYGDCIGVDTQVFYLAKSLNARTVCHPPSKSAKRSFTKADESRLEYPYLVRNKHIVDSVEKLIVVPKTFEEELRSGTWSTYRYAFLKGTKILLVTPDGVLHKPKGKKNGRESFHATQRS